jgi:DnaJ-class molecular chaperone
VFQKQTLSQVGQCKGDYTMSSVENEPAILKALEHCETHFDTLQLPRPSTSGSAAAYDRLVSEEAIRANFKRVSRLVHPDKNAGFAEMASNVFQRVKEASKVLLDAHSRTSYVKQFLENEMLKEEKQINVPLFDVDGSAGEIKAHKAKKDTLVKLKARNFQQEVMMKRMQKQKEALAKQKRKAGGDSSSSSSSSSSESGDSASSGDSSSSESDEESDSAKKSHAAPPPTKKRRIF